MARFKIDQSSVHVGRTDWDKLDRMSDHDLERIAQSDPDARPLSEGRLSKIGRAPDINRVLDAVGISAESFASKFNVPLATINDWRERETLPNSIERAFLLLLEANPDLIETIDRSFDDRRSDMEIRSSRVAYHVVPREGGWALKRAGAARASSTHATQRSAVEAAKSRVVNQNREIIIHDRNGRIRRRLVYRKPSAEVAS